MKHPMKHRNTLHPGRRDLLNATISLILLAGGLFFTTLLSAQESVNLKPYQAGTDYIVLDIPIRTRNPDVIEVTEYFSYACVHCYQFEGSIGQWKRELPAGVVFNRTPAIWSPLYRLMARTYYTAEALGVLDEIHTPLFRAIHKERRSLTDEKALARFFSEQGVAPEDFARAFNSFGVNASSQQAYARGRAYASGTPAIIVNGKYLIKTSERMLEIASFLVQRELSANQNASP